MPPQKRLQVVERGVGWQIASGREDKIAMASCDRKQAGSTRFDFISRQLAEDAGGIEVSAQYHV
ncbi:MAG TPA: hypothetical protein VKS19_02645, partial [Verrucomicrobiae bacterium]|nr:hypothetical protein [Verrucomicrobiae bacterium]